MRYKLQSIGLFMLLATALQTHARANEFENPRARATFDVCIELDSKRAELFKQMLSPPYSCAVNMEPQNVGDPSSEEFKVAYAQNLKFTRGFPNIVEYCAVVVMYCIADAPPITVENKKSATDAIVKRWYPELIK